MADAIDHINDGNPLRARDLLIAAHQHTEEMAMKQPDGVAIAFRPRKKNRQPKDPKER